MTNGAKTVALMIAAAAAVGCDRGVLSRTDVTATGGGGGSFGTGGGGAGATATGGHGGAGSFGTGGTAGAGEARVCDATVRNLGACMGETPCLMTCGPLKTGRRSCTCSGDGDGAQQMWSCPTCVYDPGRWPYDATCFDTAGAQVCPHDDGDPSGMGLPQNGAPCAIPSCHPCGSFTLASYRNANGTVLAGFCVCDAGGTYSCATATDWPPNPSDGGAADRPASTGAGGVAGSMGTGGYAGAAGAGFDGTRVPCPPSVPSGACGVDSQICPYEAATCVCDGGSWACAECPSTQPGSGQSCGGPPMRCRYGDAHCDCLLSETGARWGCGVCPAARPADGQSCGNATFACPYDNDTCRCSASGWSCGTASCTVFGPFDCHGAVYTCQYPKEAQSCSCGDGWSCSCPRALPAEGAACVGDTISCSYGEQSCRCQNRAWHCLLTCPPTPPTNGSACSSTLSCSYPGSLCHCAGNTWTCSGGDDGGA